MTFDVLARYVADNAAPDGDSVVSIPRNAPYFATPFGARLARILRTFTTEAPLLLASMQEITIPEGAREYSLVDSDNSPLAFWFVRKLWINGEPIARASSAGRVMASWGPSDGKTPPRMFAHVTKTKLVFDTTPPAGLTGCYAQGFYRHPEITADATVIDPELEDHLELFDAYAQANLRRFTASDEVGLARLKEFSADAFNALRKIQGERMRALIEEACR